jgi:integrase
MKPKQSWRHSFPKQMAKKAGWFFRQALVTSAQGVFKRGWTPSDNIGHLRNATPLGGADAVQTVADLVGLYKASGSFTGLKELSKSSYNLYIDKILERFGAMPLKKFDERGARTRIRQWRDIELAALPRTADATVDILRLLLNFAVDEEYLFRNPAAGLGHVHTRTRRDIIWTDEQIATFLRKAPRHLARVLLLAVWTGQRQSDLINLKWDSFDGRYIMLQPKKSYRGRPGRRVKVRVADELRRVLTEIELEQKARATDLNPKRQRPRPDYILTNSRGVPWSQEGFKGAWRKAVAKAGISGVTFHDLRGTFVTLTHRAGASIKEIAEATGHDEKECERLIRRHYLAAGGETAVMKLETIRQFTPRNWVKDDANYPETQERATGPRHPRRSTRFEQLCNAEQNRFGT